MGGKEGGRGGLWQSPAGAATGLHTRLVESLEVLSGDQVAEVAPGQSPNQVERLAHHALRGEVWAKALAYCRQAGEKAMVTQALTLIQRCLRTTYAKQVLEKSRA